MCKSCSAKSVGISDACRASALKSMIERSSVPEFSEKMSERASNLWQSDEYRQKQTEARSNYKYPSGHHGNWKGGAVRHCVSCGSVLSTRSLKPQNCRSCYAKSRIGVKKDPSIGDKISIAKRKPIGEIKTGQKEIREKRREYLSWKRSVHERDNNTCMSCGSEENLEAHHVKSVMEFPDLVFDVANGLTLCKTCHKETDNYGFKAYNRIVKDFNH